MPKTILGCKGNVLINDMIILDMEALVFSTISTAEGAAIMRAPHCNLQNDRICLTRWADDVALVVHKFFFEGYKTPAKKKKQSKFLDCFSGNNQLSDCVVSAVPEKY
ncbi:MAG: hypothetical protein D3909_04615 [Candidatus Electrothrix sp. ATG1]|nr:hypothetical protein [Candidatus Electrothrix sp. ATG1]